MGKKNFLTLTFLLVSLLKLPVSSELNMQVLLILEGENEGDLLGRAMEQAGDINNDGYQDFLIGIPGEDSCRGAVYIYFGSENLDSIQKDILYGEDYRELFGNEISNVGDVNGDSYNDFLIGAPGFGLSRGKAYLFLGQGTKYFVLRRVYEGDNDFDQFGGEIDGGDINGDGFNDFLISSPTYSHIRGKIYAFLGGEETPLTPYITYEGDSSWSYLGGILEVVGDINNDGYDDFVTGSSSPTINGIRSAGYFRVYFGSSSIDTIPDIEVIGDHEGMKLGYSICSGDFNGDSLDDFIVCSAGNGFVYFGKDNFTSEPDLIIGSENVPIALLETAGDINGDGYDDFLSGLPALYGNNGAVDLFIGSLNLDGIPELRIQGNWASYFGWPVSSAGDLNRDGCDEFIVGEPNYFLGIFNQGRVYIFSGDSTITGIEIEHEKLIYPLDYQLGDNYPNPFNTSMTIPYYIHEDCRIKMTIYNIHGQEIRTLMDSFQSAGSYTVLWDGRDNLNHLVSSGVYLIRMETGDYSKTSKCIFLR